MEEQDLNPYESPRVGGAESAAPAAEESQPRRRFRWRVIPVALLYIYGGCAFVGGAGQLCVFAWMLAFRSDQMLGTPLWIGGVLYESVCAVLLGCALIFVGRALWTGRWWWAGLVFMLTIVASVALANVAWLAREYL